MQAVKPSKRVHPSTAPFGSWLALVSLLSGIAYLIGISGSIGFEKAPAELAYPSAPAPLVSDDDQSTYTVLRPTMDNDPVDIDIQLQQNGQKWGYTWLLTVHADKDHEVSVGWGPSTYFDSGRTLSARLVQQYVREYDVASAISICQDAPNPDRPYLYRTLVRSIRRQQIPMATILPISFNVTETPEERMVRQNEALTNFLDEKRVEFWRIRRESSKLEPSEGKAELLEELRHAFSAVDQPEVADECTLSIVKCLRDINNERPQHIAGYLTDGVKFFLLPLVAVMATAALGVWQNIAGYYIRNGIKSVVSDRHILAALGENLRAAGIITPNDFTARERTLFLDANALGNRRPMVPR